MLLAEINGKACPEVEGIEDLITSSVFGHLRLVEPPVFWKELFRRAQTVSPHSKSLLAVLHDHGLDVARYDRIDVQFWRYFTSYGEPDLLVRFTGLDVLPFIVLIEVKLNSGKSSVGEYDQLAKYLRLLRDKSLLADLRVSMDHRYLVYLTRSFATEELKESLLAAGSPDAHLFGLEWNDILEAAQHECSRNYLLAEVADFLVRRDMQKFSGMRFASFDLTASGHFYGGKYFHPKDVHDIGDLKGSFYGD